VHALRRSYHTIAHYIILYVLEDDKVKYFVPISIRIPTILSPFASPSACLYSVMIFVLLPSPITSFGFAYYFSSLSILYAVFFWFRDKGTVIKTSAQQSEHSSSATYTFSVHRLLIFALNVITAKRHCRYHGITASCLPFPRYYREIFPVPAVITVVTAVLPLSRLPCHPLIRVRILVYFAAFAMDPSVGNRHLYYRHRLRSAVLSVAKLEVSELSTTSTRPPSDR